MANISAVKSLTEQEDLLLTWSSITESDTALTVDLEQVVEEISIQLTGTFGGATVLIQGSNDGTNYETLKQLDGSSASFTAVALASILERPLYLKPSISGGSSQSITIVAMVKQ